MALAPPPASDNASAAPPALAYPSLPITDTHPSRLAALATLYGLSPAPLRACRVLELGCAGGGNLLPLAAGWPEAKIVGVELDEAQVQQGRALAAQLGISNLELRAADMSALPEAPTADFGPFDYIICHGVFSWVPLAVQEKILRLCGGLLAEHGVAFISYNCYPGYYRRQPFRDMMLYHTEGMTNPAVQVRQARMLLRLLQLGTPDSDGTYAHMLRDEENRLRDNPDAYLYHEHLVSHHHACYFHEFMAKAEEAGLEFLTETEGKGDLDEFPMAVVRALEPLREDRLRLEQYIDFLRDRGFRRTLLCRAGRLGGTEPTAEEQRERLRGLLVGAYARPLSTTPQVRSDAPERFGSRNNVSTITLPALKALLVALHEARPLALALPALAAAVAALRGAPLPEAELLDLVLLGVRMSLLTLYQERPPVSAAVAERPLAPALARLQAQGRGDEPLSDLLHDSATVSEEERALVALCDGSRDHAALQEELPRHLRRGQIPEAGAPLEAWLKSALERLRRQALLQG